MSANPSLTRTFRDLQVSVVRKTAREDQPMLLFVDNDANSFFSYRIGLARAARDAGFSVHVASPDGPGTETLSGEGIQCHPISMTRSGVNPFREWRTILELFRLYRQLRPDLVHHIRLKPVLYGSLAARLARVPAVVNLLTGLGHVFTVDSFKVHLLRKLVLGGCKSAFARGNQRVVFQNDDDCAMFLDQGVISPSKSVVIKGSGVDTTDYLPTPEPDGLPLVLLASRMLRDKGVENFVEAASALKALKVAARFVLAGETDPGNPSAIDTERIREWVQAGIVEWWGRQSDMRAILAKSHIVCLPSLREGAPKVLIEAAACSRPIVTTDTAGCRQVVCHGENGLLVPVQNSDALASALQILIVNPELRMRMGRRGRELAVREFSLERVVRETLDVYCELLSTSITSRKLGLLEQKLDEPAVQ